MYVGEDCGRAAPIQLRGTGGVRRMTFFFALCCLGKIPGGAPFSQLHKSGNGSRVDRPNVRRMTSSLRPLIE